MKRRSIFECPSLRAGAVLFLFAAQATLLIAQQPSQAPEPDPPPGLYTLHAYANLIQIPTVVLNTDRTAITPLIPREKFDITLDSGPVFHPSKMRIEGEDPITLAVLIDDSGRNKDIIRGLADSLASLVPQYLHPSDRIVFFAADCKLFRSFRDAPPTPEYIQDAITQVLASPGLHGEKTKSACGKSVHLWDALVHVSTALSAAPGRRVILIVSPGVDHASTYSFEQASYFSSNQAIAIFGMRDIDEYLLDHNMNPMMLMTNGRSGPRFSLSQGGGINSEDMLEILCQQNGGFTYNVSHLQMRKSMQDFFTMLRGRYIMEFPRPDEMVSGKHNIAISIHGRPTFILPTGASAPLPDPAIANDPNTVPSSPSPAKVGTRRHIDNPKQ